MLLKKETNRQKASLMRLKREYEHAFSTFEKEMNISEYIRFINQKAFHSLNSNLPKNLNPKLDQYKQIRFMRSKILTTVDIKGCLNTPLVVNYEHKVIPSIPNLRLQVLISLILSPQTKDEMTFQAFESLFKDSLSHNSKEGLTFDYLRMKPEHDIDLLIRKVGFHKRKAKAIKDLGLLANDIPLDYDSLIALNGVGPKIAMLTLQNALGEVRGIGVDTHVNRFASKFEWIGCHKDRKPLKDAEVTRKLLEKEDVVPKYIWAEFNLLLVGFGQDICTSNKIPKCDICVVNNCKDRRAELDPSLEIIDDIEDLDVNYDFKSKNVQQWMSLCKERYNLIINDSNANILGDWDAKFSQLNYEKYGFRLLEGKKEDAKRLKIEVKFESEDIHAIEKLPQNL